MLRYEVPVRNTKKFCTLLLLFIRYLERNSINEVSRDNFSFSSKLVVGEYYDTNTGMRFSEAQIHAAIREVRGGYGGYGRPTASAKEQDRIKRLDEYKKEKEELRKQKEECSRQRLYDQLRKAQEREQEKHKQKLVKEQVSEVAPPYFMSFIILLKLIVVIFPFMFFTSTSLNILHFKFYLFTYVLSCVNSYHLTSLLFNWGRFVNFFTIYLVILAHVHFITTLIGV